MSNYVMFIVSENTTTCLRGHECANVNEFLDEIKEENWGKVVREICGQTQTAITNGEWSEQMKCCSIDVIVEDTKFGIHIAEY